MSDDKGTRGILNFLQGHYRGQSTLANGCLVALLGSLLTLVGLFLVGYLIFLTRDEFAWIYESIHWVLVLFFFVCFCFFWFPVVKKLNNDDTYKSGDLLDRFLFVIGRVLVITWFFLFLWWMWSLFSGFPEYLETLPTQSEIDSK